MLSDPSATTDEPDSWQTFCRRPTVRSENTMSETATIRRPFEISETLASLLSNKSSFWGTLVGNMLASENIVGEFWARRFSSPNS